MAREQNQFDLNDVLKGICTKLITRHPHVYGEKILEDEQAVIQNWEKMKQKEKQGKSVLAGLAAICGAGQGRTDSKKGRGRGFEFPNVDEVWQKIEEELEDLKVSLKEGDSQATELEFGDLLFSLVNLARWLRSPPTQPSNVAIKNLGGVFNIWNRKSGPKAEFRRTYSDRNGSSLGSEQTEKIAIGLANYKKSDKGLMLQSDSQIPNRSPKACVSKL